MLNSMKALGERDFDNLDENLIYPLNTWSSNYEKNLEFSKLLNREIFYLDRKVSKIMYFSFTKYKPFLSFPKTKVSEDKKFELIKSYLIKNYHYGEEDIKSMKHLINSLTKSKAHLEEFSSINGLDNKERKTLGLQGLKFDKSKMVKPKGKSLFNY